MEIMNSVRQTLRNSPFKFKDNYARVISGVEEGISSWVTVNYLQGKVVYREVMLTPV
jgi:Golgi nucleoside diphosphatase